MAKENRSDPFRDFNNKSGFTVLLWRESRLKLHARILDRRIRDLDPSMFPACRRAYNYPHRRNYEGWYPFISTGDFLWYESMEELRCLVLLEHTEEIISLASQPFCFSFKDNARHYPDLFALGADGSQTVYDVKPLERIDARAKAQFARTTDECSRQGWRHVVLHGVTGWEWKNLEWLACFRAEDMHPVPEDEDELLDYLQTPRTIAQAAARLGASHPAFCMPAVYHLMFRRAISYDHSGPLSLDTKLWNGELGAACNRTQ